MSRYLGATIEEQNPRRTRFSACKAVSRLLQAVPIFPAQRLRALRAFSVPLCVNRFPVLGQISALTNLAV
jgi:hypothetical protein